MPDAVWPVGRHPPDSSRDRKEPPVSTSTVSFRHFISGSLSFAFLTRTWRAHGTPFPTTLTTTALDRSSSGWFAASACTTTAKGHPATHRRAPPSPAQHRIQRLGPLHPASFNVRVHTNARKASTTPASTPRSSSTRPVLARRSDVATTRAPARAAGVALPLSDTMGSAESGRSRQRRLRRSTTSRRRLHWSRRRGCVSGSSSGPAATVRAVSWRRRALAGCAGGTCSGVPLRTTRPMTTAGPPRWASAGGSAVSRRPALRQGRSWAALSSSCTRGRRGALGAAAVVT